MTLPDIASLWIGGNLSWLEQVCLKSFADHGHRTILYTYEGVSNAPEGVEVMDANSIFPNTNFIRHKESGSPAVHADAFRYRMIQLQNVVWVDADILCVQPWDTQNEFIFGWEKKNRVVCNAVLGLPRFSRTLERLNALCADEYPIPPWLTGQSKEDLEKAARDGKPVHVSELKWGVWGPSAVTHFLNETGEMEHAMPQEAFYPVSFKDRRDLVKPGDVVDNIMTDGVYGVHLWNRRLSRRIVTNHNGIAPEDSFLGRALVRHNVDPLLAPIPDKPPPGHPTQEELRRQKAQTTAKEPTVKPAAAPAVAPVTQEPAVGIKRQRLLQSEPYQNAIDNMEGRTEQMFGQLPPVAPPISHDRILVLTSMKNEAPFILEWVAYNKAIGVTHFLVYTNDCSDNTNEILDRLSDLGLVTRVDNPWNPYKTKKKPQHVALEDAMEQPAYEDADWVLTIDVDEFVNIHVGDGTFFDLFKACNDPNVISFTWKFFGNSHVNEYEDRPIMETFTACAPEFIPKPRLGWGFKSMVHKSAPYTKIGVHRPLKISDESKLDQVRWVNGSGRMMPEMLLTNNGWRSTKRSLGYRMATLNHYILRSAESFLVKRDRGRINHTEQDQGIDYWMRRNYTSETDDRMLSRLPMMQKELDGLKADKKLAALHEEAVLWHKDKIAKLKVNPGYNELYRDLTEVRRPDAIYLTKPEAESSDAQPVEDLGLLIPEPEREVMSDQAAAKKLALLTRMLKGEVSSNETIADQMAAPEVKRHDAWLPEPPNSPMGGDQEPRFEEMRRQAAQSGGFFWEGPDNALFFEPVGRRLVVTFDNVHTARLQEQRWPWGYPQITKQLGCSVLGIMSKNRGWFRHDFVHDCFDHLKATGWFKQFDKVLFYGASMGGFGALTYARACPGANVLALEPQTTLNPEILPNDTRWPWTRKLDWTGRYCDAREGIGEARKVVVVSDPYFELDRAHVARLKGDNVQKLRLPFFGHKAAPALLQMGNLKSLLTDMADGEVNTNEYFRLLRNRRDLARFQHTIINHAKDRGHLKLALQGCEYTLKKRKARNIRLIKEDIEEQLKGHRSG
ncbi:glycosyltransferase family 2 protein [Sedimentitalea sp. CY04]|uniref:Glycosyltransferase family 2 protein n=1 Tax=Parasedimentitalea denitrificans TaxID=2211118 RepID=A0ABX0WF82_9RHOB|nr:glycosyltransferase family 2 protein [Sedimentitalea sp. CY04]NIZ62986.1 glycosyltransferase family 2 protein [Sedimentitalea sp. CY04]